MNGWWRNYKATVAADIKPVTKLAGAVTKSGFRVFAVIMIPATSSVDSWRLWQSAELLDQAINRLTTTCIEVYVEHDYAGDGASDEAQSCIRVGMECSLRLLVGRPGSLTRLPTPQRRL